MATLVALAGCASPPADRPGSAVAEAAPTVRPLPVGAGVDYQLGGPSPVPPGVGVVVRDQSAPPPEGVYAVCYVNAFQTQPEANGTWLEQHPELVLRDAAGEPLVDEDWGELLLDVRAPTRAAVVDLVAPWVTGCADHGYDAVELDNLDSYTRSEGALTREDAAETFAALAEVAHRAGLAVGQKNATGLTARLARGDADFAVLEQCGEYEECGDAAEAYAGRVLLVEYTADGLAAACAGWPRLRPVLRDLDLVPSGEPGYLRRECPGAGRPTS
ncbi:hypothetical protein GCM10012283_04310 [Phycicoccus endophyticus]|nr:hypothetical protein GCM10012283_04310 [Phycicoccus endophyticus]